MQTDACCFKSLVYGSFRVRRTSQFIVERRCKQADVSQGEFPEVLEMLLQGGLSKWIEWLQVKNRWLERTVDVNLPSQSSVPLLLDQMFEAHYCAREKSQGLLGPNTGISTSWEEGVRFHSLPSAWENAPGGRTNTVNESENIWTPPYGLKFPKYLRPWTSPHAADRMHPQTGRLYDMHYIWIFNISYVQRIVTPYFLLHWCSTNLALNVFHRCSIWPPYAQITARNRLSKFIPTLLRISWLGVLIDVFTFLFKLCQAMRINSTHWILQ